jgi:hypothetical protein
LRSTASSSNADSFEVYIPEKDPKNKARYLPPSKLKKIPSNYQGRRTVKFKGPSEYSVEQYGSLKKEKKPAPRKIQCVTEIMVDISDSESGEDWDTTTSHEKAIKYTFSNNPIMSSVNINQSVSSTSETKTMLPPDKMDFIAQIRKRSQKGREKEIEVSQEKKITESVINNLYSRNVFRMPFAKESSQVDMNKSLESMIFKKFNNKQSVNKILQKTAKLQK